MYRLSLDVTSRESILAAKKVIEEKEGKLHILVNKYADSFIIFSRPSSVLLHPINI